MTSLPTYLIPCSVTKSIISIVILIKLQQLVPIDIVGVLLAVPVAGATPVLVRKKERDQAARDL